MVLNAMQPVEPAVESTTRDRPRAAGPANRRGSVLLMADRLFVVVILVLLIAVLSGMSSAFASLHNMQNLLYQAGVLGVAAVGVTFVVICGELDLSIGANIALSGVVAALGMTTVSHSMVVGIVLGVATGLAIGAVNGFVTTVLRVPSFISTLGMLVIATGIALQLTNGSTIGGLPTSFGALANNEFLGLHLLVWIMIGVFVVGFFALHRTTIGLQVFGVGDNAEAARLAGLQVNTIRFVSFLISGLAGGIAGVLLASEVLAGQPNVGTNLTLYATAAVILGGTSMRGGQGSMLRTVLGVLLIGVVQNGLDVLGVSYNFQEVAVGVVFILAASAELLHLRVRRYANRTVVGSDDAKGRDVGRADPAEGSPLVDALRGAGAGSADRVR